MSMQPNYFRPKHRILWVDDCPANNEPIASDLQRRGILVSYALSTDLALTLLSRNSYLAVISDMDRKEGPREGFHLLDVMRSRGDSTPLIFFAGLAAPSLLEEALLHDAQGSTNDPRKLVGLIDDLIGAKV